MYLILFILHDPEKLEQVLTAWEDAGVGGITILASTGLGRMKMNSALRDDLPLIPSLHDIISHEENLNRTLLTMVNGEAMVDKVVAVTEEITGQLALPNTGVLAVLPVARLYGA